MEKNLNGYLTATVSNYEEYELRFFV